MFNVQRSLFNVIIRVCKVTVFFSDYLKKMTVFFAIHFFVRNYATVAEMEQCFFH